MQSSPFSTAMKRTLPAILVIWLSLFFCAWGADGPLSPSTPSANAVHRKQTLLVTTIADSGEGSLRQAIMLANVAGEPVSIRFDSTRELFAVPRTITLVTELPEISGEVILDGSMEGQLWRPSGITISGGGARRVLSIGPGARVHISSLTIANGRATLGGGILNRGALIVQGVTFMGNMAGQSGGGLLNMGGTVQLINSTLVDNTAGETGGGASNQGGELTVTNCTFSGNRAPTGGGLYSGGNLLLRNTIIANSYDGPDCSLSGELHPASTHNLIEVHHGCGAHVISKDPRLGTLGYYNGQTPTIPLGGASPAINMGDNASAVDENGERLQWDQRGGGDSRYVGGITDIGAFERQARTVLTVDTLEDTEHRTCTAAPGDCSLRGAIALANGRAKQTVINFDAALFAKVQTLRIFRPLPDLTTEITLDATGTAGVVLFGRELGLRPLHGGSLSLRRVELVGN